MVKHLWFAPQWCTYQVAHQSDLTSWQCFGLCIKFTTLDPSSMKRLENLWWIVNLLALLRHFKTSLQDIPTLFKILDVENIRDDLIFYGQHNYGQSFHFGPPNHINNFRIKKNQIIDGVSSSFGYTNSHNSFRFKIV